MTHCYVCGREVPADSAHRRRKVRTGETVRLKGGSRSASVRMGQRIVCRWCAKRIDAEERRKEMAQYAELGLAVLLLLAALLSRLR